MVPQVTNLLINDLKKSMTKNAVEQFRLSNIEKLIEEHLLSRTNF